MSPRNPLPRQTSANYAQAVAQCLPVKKPIVAWKASKYTAFTYLIEDQNGKVIANVISDGFDNSHTDANAQLMADAPLLLNELKLTHDALLAAFTMLSQQEQFSFEKLIPLSSRSSERLTLLMKYRHLLGGVQ